jgi:hypothetical protein
MSSDSGFDPYGDSLNELMTDAEDGDISGPERTSV